MSIKVNAENVAVPNPVEFVMEDRSAAHVILTLNVSGYPPFSHAFTYAQGKATANMPPLPPGVYDCTIIVQAFSYQALGPAYEVSLAVNGMRVAAARGTVPATGSDVGAGHFKLTVH